MATGKKEKKKVTVETPTATTPKITFYDKVMKELNKTDQEQQQEDVKAWIENAVIECQTQIQLISTCEIPKKELELKKAKNEYDAAKKNLEKSRFTISSSFETYIHNKNKAQELVSNCMANCMSIKIQIMDLQAQLEAYEEVLADFVG